MTDALAHEGWKSPKIVIGLGVLLLLFGMAVSCLFVASPGSEAAIATFDDVSSFLKVLIGEVLVPLFTALGLDKVFQAKAGSSGPLPSDGWRSRKIRIGVPVLLLFSIVAFVALHISAPGGTAPVATFAQFVSFIQILVPSVIVPMFGAMGLDQMAQAKVAQS
jgi:hypothetical protein